MAQPIEEYLGGVRQNGLYTNTDTTLGGAVSVSGASTFSGATTVSGAATFSGTVATTALVNMSSATAVRLPSAGAGALSGTSIAIVVDVNGTSYYITAFPTKS